MRCSESRSPLLSSQLRSVCLGDDAPYSTVTLGNKTNVPLNVVQGPLCMDVSRKRRKTIFYPIAAGSKMFYTSTFRTRREEYRRVYLSDDIGDIRKELRAEIRSLKDEVRRQVSQAIEKSGNGSIRVDLNKDDVAQTEPSFVVVKDLVRQIRENV